MNRIEDIGERVGTGDGTGPAPHDRDPESQISPPAVRHHQWRSEIVLLPVGNGPGAVDRQRASDPDLTALATALAAGDLEGATEAVRVGWHGLARREHCEQIGRILDGLRPSDLRAHPLLAVMLGVAYHAMPHRRTTGRRYLVAAAKAALTDGHGVHRSRRNPIHTALNLTAASMAYRLVGRADLGVSPARSARRILDQSTEEQRRSVSALAVVLAQLGTTLYHGGHIDEALDVFECGLAEELGEGSQGISNISMLAGIHALRGELPEAKEYMQLAQQSTRAAARPPLNSDSFLRVAQAMVALERFETATARAHIAAVADDRRTTEHWVEIATIEALAEMADGRPGAATAGIHSFVALRKSEGRSGVGLNRLAATHALLQLALGNPRVAESILRRDAIKGPESSIGLARVELALGRQGAALQHIREVGGARLTPRLRAEAIAIEAGVLLRFAESARARALVDHLGALLERTHQRLAATLVPDADFQRLRAALTECGYARVVGDLPEKSRLPALDSEILLTDRELVVLQALMRHASASAIAAELIVSVNTVKTQLKSLYRKLGASTRDEAIAVALDRHLVSDRRSAGG